MDSVPPCASTISRQSGRPRPLPDGLVEKYDVERRTSDVTGRLAFGYTSNEVGFGWTNGVALELLADLR